MGIGFSDNAKIIDSKPGTIFTVLRNTGGIKPQKRKRSPSHLTLPEREEIRAGFCAKQSIRAIAMSLRRPPAAISREIQRNLVAGGITKPIIELSAWQGPKPCLLEQNPELISIVLEKLELK